MPIDPHQAVGQEFTGGRGQWRREDIVLYHLSLGAGNPPSSPRELNYVGLDELEVLPTFGVVPTSGITAMLHTLPGLDFDPDMKVHGEQDLTLHGAIPLDANVTNSIRVADVYDKGSGAVVVLEIETRDEAGKLLFTNRRASFIRGEGGFGGEPGPKPTIAMPSRKPDLVTEAVTLPQQAFLYTLSSGDESPIHTDPEVARRVGYEKPILHGLCTFGVVCKSVVDHALAGEASRVRRYQARFSGPVIPGETVVTAMWEEQGRILLEARVKERDTPAISNAAITLAD